MKMNNKNYPEYGYDRMDGCDTWNVEEILWNTCVCISLKKEMGADKLSVTNLTITGLLNTASFLCKIY